MDKLYQKATKLRKLVLQMIHQAGSGHPGGSLSALDIITVLYFYEMRIDSKNPNWENRDRFVLSKGHACPALYAALAEKGFFPKKDLFSLRKINSRLQGHPDMLTTPGVEMSTGSLGQGFSAAIGMALAGKYIGKNFRVYVLLGDGELDEGEVWEGAMCASHYELDNLVAIIDYNGLQSDNYNTKTMNFEPLVEKWKAFNWYTLEIDGHNIPQIVNAFNRAKRLKRKPTVIVAHTIKGKGVSFMEDNPKWHGSLAPDDEQLKIALDELDGKELITNE
ncbi:transketolase [Candidatus Aerophobetes bacterium]|uniref:Transketolase n=1 Tax=Aerophobetes bacterium TaxID=2030807 RepID=A0A662DK35_UNCAE|nr:MAG: transketolase [Candidatus Aerophobetes bacterium]